MNKQMIKISGVITTLVIIILLSISTVGAQTTVDYPKFPDVPKSHWAYVPIGVMAKHGTITGYPDGKFKPEKTVTRAEFAKMLIVCLKVPIFTPWFSSFKDVNKGDWAFSYIESAKIYMPGSKTSNGTFFYPDNGANREEVAYALVKAKGYQFEKVDTKNISKIFTDANQISPDMAKYVLIAYNKGIIKGYQDNTFKPQKVLTRAEATKLLSIVTYDSQSQSGGDHCGECF